MGSVEYHLHNVVLREQTFEEPNVLCIKLQRIQIRLLQRITTLRESLRQGLYQPLAISVTEA